MMLDLGIISSANNNGINNAQSTYGFLVPPVAGALFLAALVANCLRGTLPPDDFLAVCDKKKALLQMNKCYLHYVSIW